MSKISVVYWSQSGNTAAMAEAVAKGITDAGKEAEIVFVSSASIDELKNETLKVKVDMTTALPVSYYSSKLAQEFADILVILHKY